jgi:hypothetical protein
MRSRPTPVEEERHFFSVSFIYEDEGDAQGLPKESIGDDRVFSS